MRRDTAAVPPLDAGRGWLFPLEVALASNTRCRETGRARLKEVSDRCRACPATGSINFNRGGARRRRNWMKVSIPSAEVHERPTPAEQGPGVIPGIVDRYLLTVAGRDVLPTEYEQSAAPSRLRWNLYLQKLNGFTGTGLIRKKHGGRTGSGRAAHMGRARNLRLTDGRPAC